MKRIFALTLFICILLCGCGKAGTAPGESGLDDNTSSTTLSTETPSQPNQPEKVTVYLLEKSVLADSGYTEYFYDENYNLIKYDTFTIENALRFTCYYEDRDANGMPLKVREVWGPDYCNVYTLTWDNDGKLLEEVGDSNIKYDYDAAGKLIKKSEYYEGALFSAVHYEYNGDMLTKIYRTNADERLEFECRVENNRIVEKRYYDEQGNVEYTFDLVYDKNGNLTKEIEHYEDETATSKLYTYKAVEVDANRAQYLLELQKHLLAIT